jgi:hypothetical protein
MGFKVAKILSEEAVSSGRELAICVKEITCATLYYVVFAPVKNPQSSNQF